PNLAWPLFRRQRIKSRTGWICPVSATAPLPRQTANGWWSRFLRQTRSPLSISKRYVLRIRLTCPRLPRRFWCGRTERSRTSPATRVRRSPPSELLTGRLTLSSTREKAPTDWHGAASFLVCSAEPRGLCGDPRIFDDLAKVPQVFRNPGGSPALQNKRPTPL